LEEKHLDLFRLIDAEYGLETTGQLQKGRYLEAMVAIAESMGTSVICSVKPSLTFDPITRTITKDNVEVDGGKSFGTLFGDDWKDGRIEITGFSVQIHSYRPYVQGVGKTPAAAAQCFFEWTCNNLSDGLSSAYEQKVELSVEYAWHHIATIRNRRFVAERGNTPITPKRPLQGVEAYLAYKLSR